MTKVNKTRLRIRDDERTRLDKITRHLRSDNWLVLDSQWSKNPLLKHFTAPVGVYDAGQSIDLGLIGVSLESDDGAYVEIFRKDGFKSYWLVGF